MKDLFGNVITEAEARAIIRKEKKRGRGSTKPQGYAAKPGTGPKDETCKSCRFLAKRKRQKTFLKCYRTRKSWTAGGGSDIRARAPACQFWQNIPPEMVEARKAVAATKRKLPVGAVNGPEWAAFSKAIEVHDALEEKMLEGY